MSRAFSNPERQSRRAAAKVDLLAAHAVQQTKRAKLQAHIRATLRLRDLERLPVTEDEVAVQVETWIKGLAK